MEKEENCCSAITDKVSGKHKCALACYLIKKKGLKVKTRKVAYDRKPVPK